MGMTQAVLVETPAPFVTPVNRNDEWATPKRIFDQWHRRLAFNVDAAASDLNHKLPTYWTVKDDGLRQDWAGLRVFNNPPWSKVHPWVEKALAKTQAVSGLILPARTDTTWYRELEFDRDTYIKHLGRVAFEDPTGGGRMAPREGAMMAVTFGNLENAA